MILGDIQAGEVVVIILDLRGIGHGKAHAGEDINDLVGDQRQGVQAAHGAGLGGQGDVHRLGRVAGCQLCLLDFLGSGVIVRLHFLLELVDDLAHGRTLFGRDRAQIFHQGRDLTVFAEVLLPESCQRFLGRDLAQGSFGLFCQLVDHCLHGCSLLLVFVLSKRGKAKAPRPLLRAKLQAKGTKRCNFTPRYHPVSARKHKSFQRLSNAVTGRAVLC